MADFNHCKHCTATKYDNHFLAYNFANLAPFVLEDKRCHMHAIQQNSLYTHLNVV